MVITIYYIFKIRSPDWATTRSQTYINSSFLRDTTNTANGYEDGDGDRDIDIDGYDKNIKEIYDTTTS